MTLPAAIAFFALGANAVGAMAILLVGSESRAVRWFMPFQGALLAWLFVLGMIHGGASGAGWVLARQMVVGALPGLFVAASLMAYQAVRGRWGWAVLASTLVAAIAPPMAGPVPGGPGRTLAVAWQVLGWTAGTVLVIHHARSSARPGPDGARRSLVVGLIVVAPLTATLGFLLDADAFFTYGMPLVTVAVQGLLLVGIVRMRFYDVEVRVSRVGRLSAETLSTARLAALGTLAASLAHEVRNPLTGVRSLAQRFRDDALDDEQRRNYADVIVRESDRVTRLVERILGVSRRLPPPVGPGEPTALGPLFDDLTLLAGPRAKERGVDLRCEATDATAVASREVLTQVLLNLVLNGVDHSPRGGCVAVAARSEPDGMVIEVSDQGPGIPPEHRTRVFEPYWSADGGTGIGLSVVKQLVADHRWQLLLDDAPGGGARIRVRVPAASTSGS